MSAVSDLLRATLDRLQMTQKKLAEDTGLSPKHINAIAQDKTGITGRTAILLEGATAVPAEEWFKARATDELEAARAELPSPQELAERYVRRALEAEGFSPNDTRLTGRDRRVIALVLQHLGAR
jgi:plasmid maintenance system antidote protein VapI